MCSMTAGLGAAALGWGAARLTEANPANLSGREKALSTAKDGLMAAAVLTGIANGVQGARLAKQAPDGAVPVETGTKPAAETPPTAAKIQRRLDTLGNLNIVAGVALVGVNAVLAQTDHSRPAKRRALTRSSSPNTQPAHCGSAPRSPPLPQPSTKPAGRSPSGGPSSSVPLAHRHRLQAVPRGASAQRFAYSLISPKSTQTQASSPTVSAS